MLNKKIKISILGSTGSIGTQALDVISAFPDTFEIIGLAASSNIALLSKQIKRFKPKAIYMSTKQHISTLKDQNLDPINYHYDSQGLIDIACYDTDILLVATPGNQSIKAIEKALDHTKNLALASKEILVVAGSFIMPLAKQKNVTVLPVDSEHAAIHQLLKHTHKDLVKKVTLSASGGPFLNRDTLENITVKEALKHPNWSMGSKISIDSATMMNKGFEIIEAHHLFELPYDQLDAIIHPQSIIHAFVEQHDGAIFAHLGPTDMRYPIQYCLMQEKASNKQWQAFSLKNLNSLEFFDIDPNKFPLFNLAYQAARSDNASTCVLSTANDIAVSNFLNKKIRFLDIYPFVASALENYASCRINSLDDLLKLDQHVRDELSKK